MKLRVVILVTALALLLTIFAGCSKGDAPPDGTADMRDSNGIDATSEGVPNAQTVISGWVRSPMTRSDIAVTYEITNITNSWVEFIWNNVYGYIGSYDYISLDRNKTVRRSDVHADSTPDGGASYVDIEPGGTLLISFYSDIELTSTEEMEVQKRAEPVFIKISLAAGKNYELAFPANSFSAGNNWVADAEMNRLYVYGGKIDAVSYVNGNAEYPNLVSGENADLNGIADRVYAVDRATEIAHPTSDCVMAVTALDTAVDVFVPYEVYPKGIDIRETDTPALYKITLEAHKTYELSQAYSTSVIDANGKETIYSDNGNVTPSSENGYKSIVYDFTLWSYTKMDGNYTLYTISQYDADGSVLNLHADEISNTYGETGQVLPRRGFTCVIELHDFDVTCFMPYTWYDSGFACVEITGSENGSVAETHTITMGDTSMEPTILQGETLTYDPQYTPSNGDIVYVNGDVLNGVYRIIAVGGQTIDISDGNVFIDGALLDEPYLSEPGRSTWGKTTYPIVVPAGYVFAMKDGSKNLNDSRVYGVASYDDIVGRIIKITGADGSERQVLK